MEILEKRIHKILVRISDIADFRRIASEALRGETDIIVSGLAGSARALFIAGLWQFLRRPLIVVTPQDRGVQALATDLAYFHGELNVNGAERVSPFPAWETDPYAGLTPHADIQQARATTLWRLRNKRVDIVVGSIRSLASRLVAPSQFDTYGLHIATGDDLSQDLLTEHLKNAAYLRQEPVGAPGEFSIRGGIVDVFSPLMRNPVRIEFFGDSVDSIREFDLDDQRSRGPVQHIDILPMQDVVISREMRSEEHTSELQSPDHLVCRLLLEKKKKKKEPQLPGINFSNISPRAYFYELWHFLSHISCRRMGETTIILVSTTTCHRPSA